MQGRNKKKKKNIVIVIISSLSDTTKNTNLKVGHWHMFLVWNDEQKLSLRLYYTHEKLLLYILNTHSCVRYVQKSYVLWTISVAL